MLKIAVAVVAIARADCVNPSLIGGELFVARGEHPQRQAVAFTLAAWIVTFAIGVALASGVGDLILSLGSKPGATAKYGLITAGGVVLVVSGAVLWIRRKALDGPGRLQSPDAGALHTSTCPVLPIAAAKHPAA